MADWDSIDYGFNASDETINFGARVLAGLDNLYETSTLASLKNSEDIICEAPIIHAFIKNGLVIFSINKTIRIFNSLLCNDLVLNITLDATIDVICSNGSYLLICLRNGVVHVFDLNGFDIVCKRDVLEVVDDNDEPIFIGAFFEETVETNVILVSTLGVVYRFTVGNSLDDEEDQSCCDTIADMECNSITSVVLEKTSLICCGNRVYVCNLRSGIVNSEENLSFKQVFSLGPGKLLGLQTDGSMAILCTRTFQTYDVNLDTLYEEIMLLSSANGIRILGITKSDNEHDSYLKSIDFPDMTINFSIKLLQQIGLVVPEHIHDEVLFISSMNSENICTELRIQAVTENVPENRLQRLLKRQKYNEAESFAKLFNLDLGDVQKAKAQSIADKLVCNKSDIDSLISIMDAIEDSMFKINICAEVHSCCSCIKDVERILNYGRLCAETALKLASECTILYEKMFQLLIRFHTFLELVRCKSCDDSVDEWNNFYGCDLIANFCTAIDHNCIEKAVIIYSRLDTVSISTLNEEIVGNILLSLNNIPIEAALLFLHKFVPLTLLYLPMSLSHFIKWTLEKVKQIESKETNNFPDNAIEFLEAVIEILKVNFSEGGNYEIPHVIHQKKLNDLSDYMQVLQVLRTLRYKYRILLPLEEFLRGHKGLLQILLSGSGVSILEDQLFFKDFIQCFVLDSKAGADEIFTKLIKDIIQYEEELWIKVVPVMLNYISTIDLKLKSVLLILVAAKHPWSKAIHEIATSTLQYSHPLVKNISKEIEFEPKCVILNKDAYKLNKQLFNSIQYVEFAVNRIIYCNLPSMVDDIFQMCKDTEERRVANVALITHFIEKGEYERALEILDNNQPEEVAKCCKKLINYTTMVLDNKYNLQSYDIKAQNYFNIIESIVKRLVNLTECDFEKIFLQETLNVLFGVYKIHLAFGIKITSYELQSDKTKNEVLDLVITKISAKSGNTTNCLGDLKKVSSYFHISENSVLLKYCERVDITTILSACERIYENDSDAESLCCAISLILKCMGVARVEFDSAQDFIDTNQPVKGLKLSKKMIMKAILICEKGDINHCIELANWIQTMYFLTHDFGRSCSAELRKEYGMDVFTVPSASAFNAFRDVLQLYLKFIGNHLSKNTKYLVVLQNMVPDTTEGQLINELQLLFSTVKCLANEGHTITAYKLMIMLQRGSMHHPDINPLWLEKVIEITKHCVHLVQIKNLSLKHIDEDFVYDLLLSNQEQAAAFLTESLRSYKRDSEKYQAIAHIYLRLLKFFKVESGQRLCCTIILMVNWWKRIKPFTIPYDKFFSKDPTELFKQLIKKDQLNLESLKEYCNDFGIDVKYCYKYYFKYLIINWNPCIEVSESEKCRIIIKNNEDELFNNCNAVIELIDDKEAVLDITNYLWRTVNFYHYEVFICILKIQSLLQPGKHYSIQETLLLFLKEYTRVSKPGQAEIEEWYTFNPDSHVIEGLSEWRLPFTPTLLTENIWNIIRPEVTLTTYEKWFEVTSILKKNLSKDDICSYVIKKVVSSGQLQYPSSVPWVIDSKHEDLIKDIKQCVHHISDAERATSVVYHLATNIPGGVDQVTLISLCYEYALKYKAQSPQTADIQRAFTKVQNKYYSISVTNILYRNKLADKQYLEMASHPPDEIIDALYRDDRICKKGLLATLSCPNINQAVDDVAKLYDFDVEERRHTLIKQWLSNDLTHIGSGDNTIDEENLVRISYICTSDDINKWRSLLLRLAETSGRNLIKSRALKCFCNISDVELVEKLTGTSYNSYRNYIQKLMIISNLESLGFVYTIDTLDQSNKYDLLNYLQFRVSTTISAKTMGAICLTYNISEMKCWNVVITAMLKLNMLVEIKKYIYFLKNNVQYYQEEFYIEAWQKVIDKSFDISYNLEEHDLMKLCISNFSMIQSCPILSSLNLENTFQKCMQMKKYEFAVLLLRYFPTDAQSTTAMTILEKDEDVLQKVQQLTSYGFCGISSEMCFFSEVVKKVDIPNSTDI